MMLTDTGPIVGLINRRDPFHLEACRIATGLPAEPMLTTWPCLTEAMYLLGRAAGSQAQDELWSWLRTGKVHLRESSFDEALRMAELMHRYRDLPMDLADASLVTVAEAAVRRKIFAFDGHFRVYRLIDGSTLELAS